MRFSVRTTVSRNNSGLELGVEDRKMSAPERLFDPVGDVPSSNAPSARVAGMKQRRSEVRASNVARPSRMSGGVLENRSQAGLCPDEVASIGWEATSNVELKPSTSVIAMRARSDARCQTRESAACNREAIDFYERSR
jgi:hypothetical protein